LLLAMVVPLLNTASAQAANSITNRVLVSDATTAANKLITSGTGIALTGTPTIGTSSTTWTFDGVNAGAGRVIGPGVEFSNMNTGTTGNESGTPGYLLTQIKLAALGAVTDYSYLTFQVTTSSGVKSIMGDFMFGTAESCGSANYDVAGVFVDNANYATYTNGATLSATAPTGGLATIPAPTPMVETCFSSALTFVAGGSLPPGTHTITIAVANTGDTVAASYILVSNIRGSSSTSTGSFALISNSPSSIGITVPSSGVFRQAILLSATLGISGTDGKVTFYANGKKIPGCQNIQSSSLTAACSWRPAMHGVIRIFANLLPSSSSYVSSTSNVGFINISARATTR